MIPGKHYYICWRSKYNSIMGGMGGLPVNTDNRLWKDEGAPFVLSFYEEGITYHYAVRDEDAEDIIGRIGKWYEDNPDARVPGNDQQDSASVELGTYRARVFPDVELLKAWFEELRAKSGSPLSGEEYYHYINPAPAPVEGEVHVTKIVEQAVVPPQPPSLPVPPHDRMRSEIRIEDGTAVLLICSGGVYLEYVIPEALIPDINEAAGEMLAKHADGYHSEWEEDAWLEVSGRDEKFDIEPEDALALFEKIAPQCGDPLPVEQVYRYPGISINEVRECISRTHDCPLCGTPRMFGKFCRTCGSSKKTNPAKTAPWRCSRCGFIGNTGAYCINCCAGHDEEGVAEDISLGYRRGMGFSPYAKIPSGAFAVIDLNMDVMQEGRTGSQAPASGTLPEGAWKCNCCGGINYGQFCCECGKKREQ
ncbi:MAG: hypothetical protein IKI38_01595 [Mogibacterium sp.]|nr:hypothetical protein [Mogibacterium sp.]